MTLLTEELIRGSKDGVPVQEVHFSIIITSYNQCAFVKAAVESAISQTGRLREIIVVDDGSSDGSPSELARYGDLIRLLQFPTNKGAIEARNQGAALAKGKYLIFLDGDDLLMPGALDVYERVLALNPKIILAERVWFKATLPPPSGDARTSTIEYVEYTDLMQKDRPYGTCASSMVISREAYKKVGGWSPGIFHMDTVDFTTKLGYSGQTVLICSPATVYYRVHPQNSVNTILPFLRMSHRLLQKERSGQYPGGPNHRFERYAWLGGVVFFWAKRAVRGHLYKEAVKLVLDGWSMIGAAIVHRAASATKGLRPIKTLELRRD